MALPLLRAVGTFKGHSPAAALTCFTGNALAGMQGFDVVLYGDSITENWRGTSAGELWKWSNGTLDSRFVGWDMRAVFLTAFQQYRTGVMAIAGARHSSGGAQRTS